MVVCSGLLSTSRDAGNGIGRPSRGSIGIGTHFAKDNAFAASSEASLDIMADTFLNEDKAAFLKLLLSGRIELVKEGTKIHVVDVKVSTLTVKVRIDGETEYKWMHAVFLR